MIFAAAAWLLGALTAMGGSFLAVNGIAHGLLGTGAQHVVVAPIQGIPAVDEASNSQAAAPLSGAAAGDDGDQDSAYLQYWSPSPGYQADDVIRGPAARASIGFEHLTSEYAISVTCSGSKVVAYVTGG